MMDDEELLISKPEVYLYDIPPGNDKSDVDHRAADWDVTHPTWQGKILIYMAGPCCHVQLDDHQGNIYAQAVIDEYPGKTLKLVSDSSRYFTLTIQNEAGNFRLVGMGFANREDSSEISQILKGYFAAALSRKRKVEKNNNKLNDASPPKKLTSDLVESIYSETNDPNYKYIKENSFQCHECPISFDCPEMMVQHWKQVHNRKKARKCLCQLPFPFKAERYIHVNKFHSVRVDSPFNNQLHNEEVVEAEKKRKPRLCTVRGCEISRFRCSHCKENCLSELQLINHFWNKHTTLPKEITSNAENSESKKIGTLGNDGSSKANSTHDNLMIDLNYPYFSESLFQCQLCTETFEDIDNFTGHWKDDHDITIIYCQCKLPFPSHTTMQAHQDKFHPFLCFVCKDRFINKSHLEEHLLTAHLKDYAGNTINSLDSPKLQCQHCEDLLSVKQKNLKKI